MSWKPEVIADGSGKWTGNLLRFATREEAEANVADLRRRWTLVRDARVVECRDKVTHRYVHGKTVPLPVEYGLKAIGFADRSSCPHAGMWLQSFDFEYQDGLGWGDFTRNPDRAKRFKTRADAMEFWQTQSHSRPRRPDGKPNRPMTALTVEIEPLP